MRSNNDKRALELIHQYTGIIQFLSILLMLIYLLIVRLNLGYFPIYGSTPDPHSFGFRALYTIGIISNIFLVIPIAIIWPLVTIIGLILHKKRFKFNYISTVLFSIATSVFLF